MMSSTINPVDRFRIYSLRLVIPRPIPSFEPNNEEEKE